MPDSEPESLILMCPVCHERFVAYPQEEPHRTACTYCATLVAVPTLAQARERRLASHIFQHPITEEYDLAPQDQTSPVKTARRLSRTHAESLEGPDAR